MILLISHGNGKTGAPISLLNLSKILKNNGYELFFISKDDDVLTPEFEKLGEVVIWQYPWKYEPNIFKRLRNRFFNNNNQRQERILKKLAQKKIELVISNTITNGDILHSLLKLQLTTLTWVHELESVIQIYKLQPNDLVINTLKHSNYFWAASNAVKENLILNHSVNPKKIEVVFEIINKQANKENILEESVDVSLIKKEGDFIIGGCGQNGWRKGTDLFLQTAMYIKKKYPLLKIKFIWIGGHPNSSPHIEFKREVKLYELEETVTIIPNCSNVNPYFKIMDIFLLTSREDPFPLAMLEAGFFKIPILGFKKSGGIEELIGGEFLSEFGDTQSIAEKSVELFHNQAKRETIATQNKNLCEKFQIQNQQKRITTLIAEICKQNQIKR
jgi:glycosyltransferase involved in cell wall biosynthesis